MQGDMSSEVMPGVIIPLNEPEDRLAAFAAVPNLGVHKGGSADGAKARAWLQH